MGSHPASTDLRYVIRSRLSSTSDRVTDLCEDRVTGRNVVRKCDQVRSTSLREARVLLGLPPGLAPRVVDLVWDGAHLSVVLNRLEGAPLPKHIPSISRDDLPSWVRALAVALERLHHAGYAHADLKPSNIWVTASSRLLESRPADARVTPDDIRLLDFASAWSLNAAYEDDAETSDRTVTPAYTAPELLRGWFVDQRADLYSLGVLLEERFPFVATDAKWGPIVQQLSARSAAKRLPNARTLRLAIERTFDLDPWTETPRFGGGILHERASILGQVVAAAHARDAESAHLLIQGRPGRGLTRFIMECVLEAARTKGPVMRTLDVSRSERRKVRARAAEQFLDDAREAGGSVLVAVSDPSPSLRWPGGAAPAWLRRRFAAKRVPTSETMRSSSQPTFVLPALSARAVREMLSDSLGRADESMEALARSADYAEGDLLRCAGVFGRVFEQTEECEDGWRLSAPKPSSSADDEVSDRPATDTYESVWTSSDSRGESFEESILSKLPADLRAAVELLAQLDERFPDSVAIAVLEEFGPRGSAAADLVSRLSGLGVVTADGDGQDLRARIESSRLRLHLSTVGLSAELRQRLDAWLLRNVVPDMTSVESVLATCHRARRENAVEIERSTYRSGLSMAVERGGFGELAKLLAYPEELPHGWTLELLKARIERTIESTDCDPSWLKLNAVSAFLMYSRQVGERFLGELLSDSDPELRANALLRSADWDIG